PDDPDAVFVEIVPRENWYRLMLETATDVGFLKIDTQSNQLLFEGDKQRYIIPADSVLSATVERFSPAGGNILYWITVLKATVNGLVWEAPIAIRSIKAFPGRNHREVGARKLHQRIAT